MVAINFYIDTQIGNEKYVQYSVDISLTDCGGVLKGQSLSCILYFRLACTYACVGTSGKNKSLKNFFILVSRIFEICIITFCSELGVLSHSYNTAILDYLLD